MGGRGPDRAVLRGREALPAALLRLSSPTAGPEQRNSTSHPRPPQKAIRQQKPSEHGSFDKYSQWPFAIGAAEFEAVNLSRVSFFNNKGTAGPGRSRIAARAPCGSSHSLPSSSPVEVQLVRISLSPRLSCFHLN